MSLYKVKQIATRIRRKCELFANSEHAADYDFYKNKSLACMCAVASFALHEALKRKNIPSKVVHGRFEYKFSHHCWVELQDKNKTIVDITATQFGIKDKVHIPQKNDDRFIFKRYVEEKNMRDWAGQRPSVKTTEKILSIRKGTGI